MTSRDPITHAMVIAAMEALGVPIKGLLTIQHYGRAA